MLPQVKQPAPNGGGRAITDQLTTELYERLRQIAARRFQGGWGRPTLQPTAVLHEAYLKLVKEVDIQGEPTRFVAAAAMHIRAVLVEHARERGRRKQREREHGARLWHRAAESKDHYLDVLALDHALSELRLLDPQYERIAVYKHFSDMSTEEIARLLGCSTSTVEKDWKLARNWLKARLKRSGEWIATIAK